MWFNLSFVNFCYGLWWNEWLGDWWIFLFDVYFLIMFCFEIYKGVMNYLIFLLDFCGGYRLCGEERKFIYVFVDMGFCVND